MKGAKGAKKKVSMIELLIASQKLWGFK